MRVARKRWGEVTIKKQGTKGKNSFDRTKSFSVETNGKNYSVEEYCELLKIVTDLTEVFTFRQLKSKLTKLKKV